MLTDREENGLSAGGDYELCYAIALAGYDIWYDERLVFKHFMPQKRINWTYCMRLLKEGAQSLEVLIPFRIRINMQCSNHLLFDWKAFNVLLYYTRKMLPLLLRGKVLKPGTEEALENKLRFFNLLYKILAFKHYKAMRQNYLKIKSFEKCLL